VNWAAFPWPDPVDCDEARILKALRAVVEPSRHDGSDARTLVRYAVGNDHRGSLYPAAVAMTEQLLLVAKEHPGEPRRTALSVLEDWWSSFAPERGFESYVDAAGARVAVIPAIVQRMTAAITLLSDIAADASDPAAVEPARHLLTVIPFGWGSWVDKNGVVRLPDDHGR